MSPLLNLTPPAHLQVPQVPVPPSPPASQGHTDSAETSQGDLYSALTTWHLQSSVQDARLEDAAGAFLPML